jgi:DNA-binding GntR family transcriptional regulator
VTAEDSGRNGVDYVRPGRSRQALNEESASYVRALIMSGELREGEFVRLDRIAADLGISVTPAREGLLLLRGEGFVVSEPRRGFVVAPLSPDDVADLFFVQATIAGELAARAARQLGEAELAEIDRLQDQLAAAARAGDGDAVAYCNHELHRTINQSAAAPKLTWFLSLSVRYVPTRFFTSIAGWEEAAAHDHNALIEALRRRDPEGARAAMEEHIRHAGELLVAHLVRIRATDEQNSGVPAQQADVPGS